MKMGIRKMRRAGNVWIGIEFLYLTRDAVIEYLWMEKVE